MAHGDAVPINNSGALKLYFGLNRILHAGDSISSSAAIKAEPAVLASAKDHGLENYPHLYSVNSAEATQIESLADDLLRYMAYGPHSIAEPFQFSNATHWKVAVAEKKGRLGPPGSSTSIIYSNKVVRPLTPVYDLFKEPGVTDSQLRKAVDYLLNP